MEKYYFMQDYHIEISYLQILNNYFQNMLAMFTSVFIYHKYLLKNNVSNNCVWIKLVRSY